jgi:hypothetical protein
MSQADDHELLGASTGFSGLPEGVGEVSNVGVGDDV